MTVIPTGTTSSVTPKAPRNRRIVLIALAVIGLAIVAELGWAGMRLTASTQVNPQGVPVSVSDGTVTVEAVEHAFPDELGSPLPTGTHAVAVTLSLTADADSTLEVNPSQYRVDGTGVPALIEPSRATPQSATIPGGSTVEMTLVYAVPDESTDLSLDLPDGQRISAEHDDHPGDRAGQ
jgi:hypothetical protein